jgi:hypothetical protein
MTPEERNAVLEEAAALLDAHVREGRVLHGAAVAAAAGWIRALKQAQPGVPEGGAPREPWGPRVRLLLAQAWKRNDERGAYGMLDVLTAGLEQLAKDMERASASAAPPAPHPDEDSPPSVDIRVTTLLAAQREKFRPAPHPEVVDTVHAWAWGGLICGLEKRTGLKWSSRWPEVTCAACLAVRPADVEPSSPPSLLRTAEQEREAVVRVLRDTAATALKRIELPATQRGPKEDYFAAASALTLSADAIERGDHLQTPGSEGGDRE